MAKTFNLGVHTADPMWYGVLKVLAMKNRNNPTDAERVLWQALKGSSVGLKFRRQHIIEDFSDGERISSASWWHVFLN